MIDRTRCPRCGATVIPPLEPLGDAADWVCPSCGAMDTMQFDEAGEAGPPDEPD